MRTLKQEHYFPIIIGLHFILWWIDLSLYKGSYEYTSKTIAGEVFSSWVVTVFAANFLMATRWRWVEKLFGGLDKMYLIHRRSAIIAVVLLILHFIIVPRNPEFSIGKPLGFYALVLILIGVILSAAPVFKRKLKYNKWINIHKLMGIFYIIGIAHSFNVPTLTYELPLIRTYVLLMALLGIVAWFYKAFLFGIFNKKLAFKIVDVKKFNNDITELNLDPLGNKLNFKAGQFSFVSLPGMNSKEFHPFTISNHPSEDRLRLTIKSLGDYTAKLQNADLKETEAKVQGAYGLFNFKKAKYKKQIWLAGGIGVTPFLSFIKELDSDYQVDFIWSVKQKEEANYRREIEEIASTNSRLAFHLWDSKTKSYFTIDQLFKSDDLYETSVFICGPKVMREAYIKQLLEKGLSIWDIHYEEFSFR